MHHIIAFYKFAPIEDLEAFKLETLERAQELEIIGTILVAHEGINGTVSGPSREAVDALLAYLRSVPGFEGLVAKHAETDRPPFGRLSVRIKKEIVAMGVPHIDPNAEVGTYVEPQDWDALITRDDITLIDCRNSYEFDVGTFAGAIDPKTKTFREFPEYARTLDPATTPRVAMFCTGGIRCEKSTGLLLEMGFEEVYHLNGGILRYLEERGDGPNLWQGDCFVFDRRISVDAKLQPGEWDVCWACRMPVSDADRASEHFEEGVSCDRCFDSWTEDQRAGKRERHRQVLQEYEATLAQHG